MNIVVPIRLAARERIIQTTSKELTPSRVRVATEHRPNPADVIALRLYLPDSGAPAGTWGRVASAGDGEAWLDLVDTMSSVSARIADFLSRQGEERSAQHRLTVRYPTSIAATIESEARRFAGRAIDLSSGGAFVRSREPVELGARLEMKLLMPGSDGPVAVGARVVHVCEAGRRDAPWVVPGFGLQFVDGDDRFRDRLDRLLAGIASSQRRTA